MRPGRSEATDQVTGWRYRGTLRAQTRPPFPGPGTPVPRTRVLGRAAAVPPLGAFYRDVVLPNWGFFGILLTAAELVIGIGLLLGVTTRLAALAALVLIGPIWLMLLHTNLYLWEYPLDLFPLVLLANVPAGRTAGLDGTLAHRFHHRWPF